MLIAVTGATGFVGRYIVNYLLTKGHACRCWMRPSSDIGGFSRKHRDKLEFLPGRLNDEASTKALVKGADAVVHCALAWPKQGKNDQSQLAHFAEGNMVGTLRLMEASWQEGVSRFIYMSTMGVHDVIEKPQEVDESTYICPSNHYAAHKAAVEKFVHSYGYGYGWNVCALRPAGVYGLTRPLSHSRWYQLVADVMAGRSSRGSGGTWVVHAIDVARAVAVLLEAKGIAGQCYDCVDMYVSQEQVSQLAAALSFSEGNSVELPGAPRFKVDASKLKSLGMAYGGDRLLVQTVRQLLELIPLHDGDLPSPYLHGHEENPYFVKPGEI